jgi:hypothetical protein
MQVQWTAALVVGRLKQAFRKNPEIPMFSAPEYASCKDDIKGLHLIQATAIALGMHSPSRMHLLYHARALASGETIYKLCQNRSWSPQEHYREVNRASRATAQWLNKWFSSPANDRPKMWILGNEDLV